MKPTVAVLFARKDSVYKTLSGLDVWDIERDARLYGEKYPVVTHPPCRAWGSYAHLAKPRPDEKDLARFAVRTVRELGGVLEHPARSKLWADQRLPAIGTRDAFGGFTIAVHQFWWGHRAQKATWLYIVGCEPGEVPDMPIVLGEAPCVIGSDSLQRKNAKRRKGWYKPGLSQNNRERTPPAFAEWLVELARRCKPADE